MFLRLVNKNLANMLGSLRSRGSEPGGPPSPGGRGRCLQGQGQHRLHLNSPATLALSGVKNHGAEPGPRGPTRCSRRGSHRGVRVTCVPIAGAGRVDVLRGEETLGAIGLHILERGQHLDLSSGRSRRENEARTPVGLTAGSSPESGARLRHASGC